MTRTETVTSVLLSDPPPSVDAPAAPPVSADYADTVAAGYVEDLEAFGARITGLTMTLRGASALTVLAALASFRLLLWGHRTWRAT